MEFITTIDNSILEWIQSTLRCDFMDAVMGFFSYIGEAGIIWLAIAITLLFFRRYRAAGVMMVAALALGYLIGDIGIKHIVCRPRPCHVNEIDMNVFIPTSYSFPSGHSTAAFSCTTILMTRDKRLGIPALILALIIVFSRMYNYVHYPSDVLCGMVLGVICALIILLIFRKTGLEDKITKLGRKRA